MAARKKPELLIPASSLDVLKTAVTYGADAVHAHKLAAFKLKKFKIN